MEPPETLEEKAARLERRKEEQAEKDRRRANAVKNNPTGMLLADSSIFEAREERKLVTRTTRDQGVVDYEC